jgi:hypothetical protein
VREGVRATWQNVDEPSRLHPHADVKMSPNADTYAHRGTFIRMCRLAQMAFPASIACASMRLITYH